MSQRHNAKTTLLIALTQFYEIFNAIRAQRCLCNGRNFNEGKIVKPRHKVINSGSEKGEAINLTKMTGKTRTQRDVNENFK